MSYFTLIAITRGHDGVVEREEQEKLGQSGPLVDNVDQKLIVGEFEPGNRVSRIETRQVTRQ